MLAFSPDQAIIFQEEATKEKNGIIFNFALVTGMRPEEYLGLRWSDLDLERSNATIRRTLVWLRGGGWNLVNLKRLDHAELFLSRSSYLVLYRTTDGNKRKRG